MTELIENKDDIEQIRATMEFMREVGLDSTDETVLKAFNLGLMLISLNIDLEHTNKCEVCKKVALTTYEETLRHILTDFAIVRRLSQN